MYENRLSNPGRADPDDAPAGTRVKELERKKKKQKSAAEEAEMFAATQSE